MAPYGNSDGLFDFVLDAGDAPGASVSLDILSQIVTTLALRGGIETSLISQLAAARGAVERGDLRAAVRILQAFALYVEAHRGISIPEDIATGLNNTVGTILDSI